MRHHTYVINLNNRTDRLNHIINEFSRFQEFDLKIFPAIKEENGALGLFKSFKTIVNEAQNLGLEYVIICEDDHLFTADFDINLLNRYIEIGIQAKIDLLLGGPSNIHDLIFVNDDLLWINGFTGLQFTIVFRSFYHVLKDYIMPSNTAFDLELGKLSNNIFCFYPPFSEQIYFGYSDVTEKNNQINVKEYFEQSRKKMDYFYLLSNYYSNLQT
ncbi:hypothetical protein [Sphingobacterium sp. GVS05A]|uniref:hypothetical protein n=1 Tax=Sphingobacterium sp. GVS05A TaxID=2862679 RepID=UPI001CBD5D47|nr:hypothetical protein [Sphingobacterium sp. GVS05A]